MISVENLYFVLYANLLRPAGLDCVYYYPFGTTQNLSHQGEYQPCTPKHEHHVLFHFDQEPLYDNRLGREYDYLGHFSSTKILRILANSEHSLTKREVCRERSMSDWYFFYHGLACQDWFRDAQYLPDLHQPQKVFCSFNHLVTEKRSYRMALTARLINAGLDAFGDISFHASKQTCEKEIASPYTALSQNSKHKIALNILDDRIKLPMIVDHHAIDGTFSARFGHQEYQLWQRAFFHVVNETVFYDTKLHLTEKIFKPIVSLRPFILTAAPGNLSYLKSYGFQTFDTWIDESYDHIVDHDERLDLITREIGRLCALTPSQLRAMHQDMMPVLSYNKNHFFRTFKNHVVNELVDNFDACVRVWNNGRIDSSRCVHTNYDTDRVKNLLKQ